MIYLAKQTDSPDAFYLRVLKDVNQKALKLDENKAFEFLEGAGGHSENGEKMDLLNVWVQPVKAAFPSVLYSEKPILPKNLSSSKKVTIKLINTKNNQIQAQTDFTYGQAFIEKSR